MGPPELCGAGQWLVGFLELSRSKIFKMEGAQNRRFAILKNPHFHYGSGQILDLGASCSQQSSKEAGGSRGLGRPLLFDCKTKNPHFHYGSGQILDLENGVRTVRGPHKRSQEAKVPGGSRVLGGFKGSLRGSHKISGGSQQGPRGESGGVPGICQPGPYVPLPPKTP